MVGRICMAFLVVCGNVGVGGEAIDPNVQFHKLIKSYIIQYARTTYILMHAIYPGIAISGYLLISWLFSS